MEETRNKVTYLVDGESKDEELERAVGEICKYFEFQTRPENGNENEIGLGILARKGEKNLEDCVIEPFPGHELVVTQKREENVPQMTRSDRDFTTLTINSFRYTIYHRSSFYKK